MDYYHKYLKYKNKYLQLAGATKTINISDKTEFQKIITSEIKKLGELFKSYGEDIRIVGGTVRDILSNNEINDIDFSTTANPKKMVSILNENGIKFYPSGIEFGTVTVILDGLDYEITSLRKDINTDGRHAEVEYVRDWEIDANRRDLTINAMNLDLEGNIGDYFNGIDDLSNSIINFVGSPKDRIEEDFLRILRYFRFHSRYGDDKYASDVIEAINETKIGMKKLSGERVSMELTKLVKTKNAARELIKMTELDINEIIGLPKLLNIDEFKRLKSFSDNTLLLIIALLPNNVGKILKSLKFTNKDIAIGKFIDSNKSKVFSIQDIYLDIYMQHESKQLIQQELYKNLFEYQNNTPLLKQINEMEIKKFPIKGNILIEKGIKGPQIRKKMDELKLFWINNNFEISEEDIERILV